MTLIGPGEFLHEIKGLIGPDVDVFDVFLIKMLEILHGEGIPFAGFDVGVVARKLFSIDEAQRGSLPMVFDDDEWLFEIHING